MRILVIDANEHSSKPVKDALDKQGFQSTIVNDIGRGFELAVSRIYDVLIIDSRLPHNGAADLIRKIRTVMFPIPIIVICERSTAAQRASYLDFGADDTLIDAADAAGVELGAHIRAIMRRNSDSLRPNLLTVKDTTLNLSTFELTGGRGSIRLVAREMQFAELLFKYNDKIVTKKSMIEAVWGEDNSAYNNNVEVHISILRKKLHQVTDEFDIRAVRGVGYKLV